MFSRVDIETIYTFGNIIGEGRVGSIKEGTVIRLSSQHTGSQTSQRLN